MSPRGRRRRQVEDDVAPSADAARTASAGGSDFMAASTSLRRRAAGLVLCWTGGEDHARTPGRAEAGGAHALPPHGSHHLRAGRRGHQLSQAVRKLPNCGGFLEERFSGSASGAAGARAFSRSLPATGHHPAPRLYGPRRARPLHDLETMIPGLPRGGVRPTAAGWPGHAGGPPRRSDRRRVALGSDLTELEHVGPPGCLTTMARMRCLSYESPPMPVLRIATMDSAT